MSVYEFGSWDFVLAATTVRGLEAMSVVGRRVSMLSGVHICEEGHRHYAIAELPSDGCIDAARFACRRLSLHAAALFIPEDISGSEFLSVFLDCQKSRIGLRYRWDGKDICGQVPDRIPGTIPLLES